MNPADLPRAVTTERTPRTRPEPRETPTVPVTDSHVTIPDRSRDMHLLHEALARAQMEERLREAELQRRAAHVRVARKMKRRAEVASLRARRALALAVMQ